MSVKVMAAVFDHSRSKGSARLVLLAIADAAHESGVLTQYARSQAVLAQKANVDVDTVRRSVASLVELGELSVLAAGHGRASADYRVMLPGIDQTPQIAGTQFAGAAPANGGVRPRRSRGQTPQDAGSIIPSLSIDPPSLPGIAAAQRARKATAAAKPTNYLDARAVVIADEVWKRADPKPALGYPQVRAVARKLAVVRADDAAIVEAMLAAPTITVAAVEIVLNGRRPNRKKNGDGPALAMLEAAERAVLAREATTTKGKP